MNLFRSEEHARNWSQFDPAYEEHLKPLAFWAERFSADRYKARARPDHFSWCLAHAPADQATKR